MRGRLAMVLLLSSMAASACSFGGEDIAAVPESPDYETDVSALLAAHCTLCHGARASRGAPGYFRLDRFDDADGLLGARSMAGSVLRQIEADAMPPAATWGDGVGPNGKKMLRLWVEAGAPKSKR